MSEKLRMYIHTSDVVSQLRLSYTVEAKALAGSNKLVSRVEATKVVATLSTSAPRTELVY